MRGLRFFIVLGLFGVGCSSSGSCWQWDLRYPWGSGGSGGSANGGGGAGSGGGGASSTSSAGGGDVCPDGTTCETIPKSPDWKPDDHALIYLAPPDQPWMGCPDTMPLAVWDGYAELVQATCPVCSCQPPNGSCDLPTTLRAYYTDVCPAPANAPYHPFDAPMGWTGSCTPASPVPPDPSCVGNTCIQGVTIDPPIVKDPPACTPGIPTPMAPVPAHWAKVVHICIGTMRICGDDKYCITIPPPGFLSCLQSSLMPADASCPPSYPTKLLAYTGFTDMSSCSPCACEAPVGSKCSTAVSIYTEKSDCTGPQQVLLVDSTKPACASVSPAGAGLLSKRADPAIYTPGSCAPSGGELLNPAEPDEAGRRVLCCQ